MLDVKEKHNVLHKSAPSSTTKEVSRSKESSPPPLYAANPPDITAGFSGLNLNQRKSAKPTRDRCIAHLKLLECFHELRETIATTDGLYGIWDNFVPSYLNERDHAALLTKVREKRWSIYVAQAAKRFEAWWKDCIGLIGSVVRPWEQVVNPSLWKDDPAIIFSNADLPPIDVLMVWHTFMLNPRDYLADCIRYGKRGLWTNGFPWEAVNACIDNETFEYETSKEAREFFESSTKLPYDALKMPWQIEIDCPSCSRAVACAWTTCTSESSPPGSYSGDDGRGFAEKSFRRMCDGCSFTISHEKLRAHKLYKDVQLLMTNGTPMPGTLLDHSGMFGEKHKTDQYEHFPNHLFKEGGLDKEIIRVLNPRQKTELLLGDMDEVRSIIEKALKDRKTVRRALNSLSRSQLRRTEKIAIRRMMSCYWENSSPFSLDLVGAVIRQGTFIEKMHAIDWLHSPSISATMDRLLVKYSRFFDIMGKHSNNVAVPTLDVDLAWHTHQLSCKSYYTYATAKTSTFIDHDDKIEENKLSDAFEWTSKTYQKMYNEVYSECTCWYCEAIRESHTSVFSGMRPGHKELESDLDRLHSSPNEENNSNGNPHNCPHISAHNAIKTTDDTTKRDIVRANGLKKAYQLEANYKKACQRAVKKGRQPPQRDEYMTTAYAYGYPIYVPYYAPYMGDPCISGGMYASNPGCANVAAGAAGNCCTGTCGGMVAAGGCGGAGAGGACAGGAAGGCGGGGGGGGGGCGGGGGGGGG